jgi:hypothetical protein
MVVPAHNASRSFAVSPAVQRMGFGAVAFTVEDMQTMVADHVLPEDSTVELLDGTIIYRDRFDLKGGEIVLGIEHDFVTGALADLNPSIKAVNRHLRVENTLVCSKHHAPIPDACILRGSLRDFATRYPAAADAWCVIEVADSSYERDAGAKLAGYARAGVGQYIIINLRNRTAEVYTEPVTQAGIYSSARVIAETEQLSLQVGPDECFGVVLRTLLP